MQVAIYFKPAFLLVLASLIPGSLEGAYQALAKEPSSTAQPTGELTVIIGQPCDHPYVVAVPTRSFDLLEQLQVYIPEAFLTRSSLGSYIQAGSFKERASAERLSQQLQEQKFDARVTYYPVLCQPQN